MAWLDPKPGTKGLGGEGFGSFLVRNALFAVREAVRTEEALTCKNWLRNEDATAARLVFGAVENDHA